MASPHMACKADVVAMDPVCVLLVVAPIDASPALLVIVLYARIASVIPELRITEQFVVF